MRSNEELSEKAEAHEIESEIGPAFFPRSYLSITPKQKAGGFFQRRCRKKASPMPNEAVPTQHTDYFNCTEWVKHGHFSHVLRLFQRLCRTLQIGIKI